MENHHNLLIASIIQIPTTRPISPKLGRPKNTMNDSENGATGLSPKVGTEMGKSPKNSLTNGGKGNAASMKQLKRSQSKPEYGNSVAAKTEGKSGKAKLKATEDQDGKSCTEKNESIHSPELALHVDMEADKNVDEDNLQVH